METVLNLACLFLLSHLSITAANLELISSDKTPCRKSAVNYNVTLSKGAKAGKYYKMAGINKMDECLGHCCGSKRCDVAFMVNKNCYLVKCFNSDSCTLKQSDNPKFDTMLSVVSKSQAKTTKGTCTPLIVGKCTNIEVNEIHNHKTRSSSSDNFYIKSSSLSLNQRSFARFGAKLWNSYRDKFRQLPKSAFKKHGLLLSIKTAEDNYVETPILLHKIAKFT